MKTYTEHIFEELIDNSPEGKLRRYLERKRREREERERNRPRPKSREELQDMIIAAIKEKGPEVDLNYIDVSVIDDMHFLFDSYYGDDEGKSELLKTFNGDISEWDVSNVKNMSYMFWSAKNFNGDISDWDVSRVTNMRSMFYRATRFNQDISKWDVSSVTYMVKMFYETESFNRDISAWNTSNVTDMSYMFYQAESFNQDISKWNVGKVNNANGVFDGCPIKEEYKPKKFQN